MSFGKRVHEFYKLMEPPKGLPRGVEIMNPHSRPEVQQYVKKFLDNFFSDNNKRVLVFGINPGRFGAGITGITFTDPVTLETYCRIPNNFDKKRELSADFVYRFIDHWGGVDKFYSQFFLTAVSPLGFIKNSINYNYYDDPKLLKSVTGYIADSIQKQIDIGGRRDATILLGSGKNKVFFDQINKRYNFFKTIYTLDHPRFIMQYRRKQVPAYLDKYTEIFSKTLI